MAGFWSIEDESERQLWEDNGIKSDRKLQISYRDRHGQLTQRDIDVIAFDEYLGIMAYCNLRYETRTFLFDRIESCIDKTSSESIQSGKVFDHLYYIYQQTPEYSVETFFSEQQQIIQLIVYFFSIRIVGYHEEIAIFKGVCEKYTGDKRITKRLISDALDGYEATSERGFKQRVGRLRNNTDIKYRVNLMKLMIAIAKRLHPLMPEELDALKYMRKNLFTKEESIQAKPPHHTAADPALDL